MEIIIRKGTLDDLNPLIELLCSVWEELEQKYWLYIDPPEEIRQLLDDGFLKLWVAMDGQTLAAAFSLLIPGLESLNYGYDLNFSDAELLKTVNMDTVVVHPDYRGRGLQQRLMLEGESWAKKRGYQTLMCTVHPDNCFSLNNMLQLGYTIQLKIPKYGSVRYVLMKNISEK